MKKNEWLVAIESKVLPEEFTRKEKEITQRYRRYATLPGFRKGKAPLEMVKKRFEKEIEGDVVEAFANEVYRKALKENSYKPLSFAKISYWNILENKELRFEIEVEVEPEFELPEYKNIKVSKELKVNREEEIEKRLKAIAERNAIFVKSEKAAERGDYILVDYSVYDEGGKKISKHENVLVECGDPENFPEINAVLEGARAKDVKICEITYPDEYPDKSLAKKKFQYKFFIKEVKEKRVPPIDDELAKEAGFENLEALKRNIEEEISKEIEEIIEKNIENQIIVYLLENTKFNPPPSLVEEEYQALLLRYGLSDSTEVKKKLMPRAANTVKIRFILKKIAEKEGIETSEEEIEKEIEKRAEKHGIEKERARMLWRKEPVKEDVINKKVLEFLKKHAIVEGGIIVHPNSH